MARVKIVLHGYLKDLWGKETFICGDTAAEVINGFCKQTKCLDVAPGQERHQVRIHGFDNEQDFHIKLDDDLEEFHIMPDLRGGKSGGFFKVVLGAVLIAVSFSGLAAGVTLPGILGGGSLSSALFKFGLNLILGGLLELLSPAPELDSGSELVTQQDPEASKYLGANKNTVKIGTRIPLLYGEHKTFGHYLSFNVDAKNV